MHAKLTEACNKCEQQFFYIAFGSPSVRQRELLGIGLTLLFHNEAFA